MHETRSRPPLDFQKSPHVLVVEARYYADIADGLLSGAVAVLESHGATYDRLSVPGALEIPAALAIAEHAALIGSSATVYDGYIVLGCVIRGATTHYEIVSNESARGVMDIAVQYGVAVGNGILTCENKEQAVERADPAQLDKGGDAAYAALSMIAVREKFGLQNQIDTEGDVAA